MGFSTVLIYMVVGVAAGFIAHRGFLGMPDSWLLDYDQSEIPEGFSQARSFPLVFQGIVFIGLNALLYSRVPYAVTGGWEIAAALMAIPILLLILVADLKTRIIPDQLTLALIVPGVLRVIGSLMEGKSVLDAAGRPLLAALIAGGSLLLIGLTGQWILKKEAMGMGDVKMIAAAAFLTGLDHLLKLVLLSFLTAALIAIPLLASRLLNQKNRPDPSDRLHETRASEQSDEDLEDPPSDTPLDPDESDEDTAIAFGPFIAAATLLLILFSSTVDRLAHAYWSLFLR